MTAAHVFVEKIEVGVVVEGCRSVLVSVISEGESSSPIVAIALYTCQWEKSLVRAFWRSFDAIVALSLAFAMID